MKQTKDGAVEGGLLGQTHPQTEAKEARASSDVPTLELEELSRALAAIKSKKVRENLRLLIAELSSK